MKNFFKWGCITVIGLLVLVSILVAIAPDTDGDSSTATPGQSLAVIAPTATPATIADATSAQVEVPATEPTVALLPTPSPLPTETTIPTPMPEPLVMTGLASNITADFQLDAPLIIVEYTHSGSGYFGVHLKNAESAEDVALIANLAGAATGSSLTEIEPGSYFYEVSADGNWTITTKLAGHWIKQPQATAYSFAGRGSSASPIFMLNEGRANVALTHNGQGYFGVMLYTTSGEYVDLLANVAGAANESTSVAALSGEYIMRVEADGDWTVQVSQ